MKARLNLFGENYAGTWAREVRNEVRILVSGPGGKMKRREPYSQDYAIFTTDTGTCYRIALDARNPVRDDYPVEVVGVGESPSAFVECRAGTGQPATVKCARIRYADGFEETASFTITDTSPAVKSEVERIAAMTIREAVDLLMKAYSELDRETLQIGIRHMTGQTWTQIQKDMKRSRETVMKRIDAFYAATAYPRPDRVRGKGKRVQFDDNRDTMDHLDTRPPRGKRTNSRTVRTRV